jgi:hypothetical protein
MTVPVAITSNAPRVAVQRRRADHVFFTAISILMAVGVGAGFSRTYAARLAAGTTTPLIHVHGAVFAVWMLLFILRPSSSRSERRACTGVSAWPASSSPS